MFENDDRDNGYWAPQPCRRTEIGLRFRNRREVCDLRSATGQHQIHDPGAEEWVLRASAKDDAVPPASNGFPTGIRDDLTVGKMSRKLWHCEAGDRVLDVGTRRFGLGALVANPAHSGPFRGIRALEPTRGGFVAVCAGKWKIRAIGVTVRERRMFQSAIRCGKIECASASNGLVCMVLRMSS